MPQVSTNKAPQALGPYSQGIRYHDFIFASGQIGADPETGELASGVEAQTAQALENLSAVLDAGGSGLAQVIKTTCYLADMADFDAFNEVYGKYFITHPARECVQAAALPAGALVEISAVGVSAREHIF